MTNSHNKIMASNTDGKKEQMGTTTERYFNNTSPSYLQNSGRKQGKTQRSPSTKFFSSKSSAVVNKGKNDFQNNIKNSRIGPNLYGNRSPTGGLTKSSNNVLFTNGSSGSPPNFSYFASSKMYDAPAPNTLPKPPSHWTSCASEVTAMDKSKKFDVFSHNLKSILNVQA